jgi:hypothetical protein
MEKTKYMFMSDHKDCTSKSLKIKVANIFTKNVAKFKHLGMTVTNQNCIHEEIKSRLIL